jgi:hypothetical protein
MKEIVVVSLLLFPLLSGCISPVGCGDLPEYIYDNLGNVWEPTGTNLATAFSSLQENGELWFPCSQTITVASNLYIEHDGIKIHGRNSTIIFTNARLVSSAFASSGSDTTRFTQGLDDIILEDFTFIGTGNLEIVLGDNTIVRNVHAEEIYCQRPGAFRFVVPTGDSTVDGLTVTGCSANKVWWHGMVINSVMSGSVYDVQNVLFERCQVKYAGYQYEGRPFPRVDGNWSIGIDICENYDSSDLTVSNVLVKDCTAEYCWESGFHQEDSPVKVNVKYENCVSNNNGQKRNYMTLNPSDTFFCSGFLVSTSGVTLQNCQANQNKRYGFFTRGSVTMTGCTGVENSDGLFGTR